MTTGAAGTARTHRDSRGWREGGLRSAEVHAGAHAAAPGAAQAGGRQSERSRPPARPPSTPQAPVPSRLRCRQVASGWGGGQEQSCNDNAHPLCVHV